MRLDSTYRLLAALAMTSVPLTRHATAQVARGEIAIVAGTATDQRGQRSNALSIAPSLLYSPDSRLTAGLALSATQFGSDARAFGTSGALDARVPLAGPFALGASAGAAFTSTSFHANYSSFDATPTLEAAIGDITVFAGAHVAAGGASSQEQSSTPGGVFSAPTLATRTVSSSRSSVGPVFGATFVSGRPGAIQRRYLSYREEHARVASVAVVDRTGGARFGSDALNVALSGGLRDARDERIGFVSASATIAVARSVSLQSAAGTYPSNRILGTPGGRFANVGVVIHGIRRLDASAAAPSIRGAPAVPGGATRLSLRAPNASRVEVAGDWNDWTPTPAARADDGVWYADVRLPRGEYRYAFKVNGGRWTVPDGVDTVDDGFGGRSALIAAR
ncbi:MAG: hypothetical protein H0W68_12090 [Gemmatimonadaceae bacterium]|nr:hypothetical protein [Gemmatimonadaceae bacterium]